LVKKTRHKSRSKFSFRTTLGWTRDTGCCAKRLLRFHHFILLYFCTLSTIETKE